MSAQGTPCTQCGGDGKVIVEGGGDVRGPDICPRCHGTGTEPSPPDQIAEQLRFHADNIEESYAGRESECRGELDLLREAADQLEQNRSQLDAVVEALEAAETFIEQVTGWTGTDPDERDETLEAIRKALPTEQPEEEKEG